MDEEKRNKLFAAYGVSADAILDEAARYLATLPLRPVAVKGLRRAEASVLAELGWPEPTEAEALKVLRKNTCIQAAREALMHSTALSIQRVAELLSIAERQVVERAKARTLFGIEGHDGLVFPAFQFHHNKEIPKLSTFLSSLDPDIAPIAVENFLEMPIADLDWLSPIAWLTSGGELEPVMSIFHDATTA